ncbi:MAG: hypothetical protein ACTSU5_17455 [Promethearchaeota archaeon]
MEKLEEPRGELARLRTSIRKIEDALRKGDDVSEGDLDPILEYTRYLNRPLGFGRIPNLLVEFKVPNKWVDLKGDLEVPIKDQNLEIARVLFLLGYAREREAEKYEVEGAVGDAVQALTHSARAYLTASIFSRVILQEERRLGSLDPESLEFRAENLRELAQSLLVSEAEGNGDWKMAARLSMGLSWINRRISFLARPKSAEAAHVEGLVYFDRANACKSMAEYYGKRGKKLERERLASSAAHFLQRAIEHWKGFLERSHDLAEDKIEMLRDDIEISRAELGRLGAERPFQIDEDLVGRITPHIPVPENRFLFFPKVLGGLVQVYDSYLRRKEGIRRLSKAKFPRKTLEELKQDKFSLERTIVELRKLVREGSISADEFSNLSRKYMEELYSVISVLNRTRE